MVRTPSYDKNGIKKGAWSAEEDHLLRAYITRYGHWNWRELPKFAGLKRCGKSCRLRWMNYLRPNLKHGSYTKEEEDLIIQLHQKHGNKWAILASKLPGRTDNEIKNHWHTHLKKRVTPHKSITNKNEPSRPQPLGSDVSADGSERSRIKSTVYQILESCPLLSPEATSTSTPMSRDLSASSTLSSFEISTVQFDDDRGWEEIINSSELFAELASFSPLDLDAETILNSDQPHATYNTFNGEDSAHPETSTTMDVYREIHFHDDDFWRNSFTDNINEVLLSSCVNYYDDNVLDFFCDHAAADVTMEDLPYKVNSIYN